MVLLARKRGEDKILELTERLQNEEDLNKKAEVLEEIYGREDYFESLHEALRGIWGYYFERLGDELDEQKKNEIEVIFRKMKVVYE